MNEEKVVLYAHAGSGNHGCEALANTICKLVRKQVKLVTNSVEEDEAYSLKGMCEIVPEKNIRKNKLIHILYYGWRILTKDRESFQRYRFGNVLGKNSCKWNISIGGDNYCYDIMIQDLILANSMFHKNGGKTYDPARKTARSARQRPSAHREGPLRDQPLPHQLLY